ncbi:MAG: M20/M25/M40 family metallo-hydrolase [Gemmatimonadetes bacterium]|nr:M20/M25/M40 family metallo-hydrolase [Gemmatimonadota bacterium]
MSVLAADSLEGRRAGSEGSRIAGRLIAEQFELAGLEAVGDSGFFQRVPLRLVNTSSGRPRTRSLSSWAEFDSLPPAERVVETNVIGVMPGSDPELRGEYVLVTAHFDHVGIGRPVETDSIYNGADDDASGVVGLIEIARALASAPPRRTVVFAAMAGEELGLLGTRWYVDHPAVPLAATVASLNLEMIGRPDTAIGPGRAWLTGYERTSMGPEFTAAGLAVDPDPRPGQSFYERSDNIAFARIGIPAHTLSSFGLHSDYHSPDDEVERIDFDHLESVIAVAAEAVRLLADGPAPEWKPGGQP